MVNHGPRGRKGPPSAGRQVPINIIESQVSFDKAAFAQLINAHGVQLTHFKAVPDPTGMASRGDSHAVQGDRRSSDGFIYKEAGCLTAFFSMNQRQTNAVPEGELAHATAYLTLPETYDNSTEPVLVSPWDRFYVNQIELRVVTRQYVEAHPTGIDRLNFPATCVEFLIDATGAEYKQGVDFEIMVPEGHIKWLTQRRPGWNPTLGRGTVYSIRYRYTPYFIVGRILHEIRVARITDPSGKRFVERMPYQVEVFREFVFLDKNRDSMAITEDPRFDDAADPSGKGGPPDAGGMMGPTG